MLVVISNPKRFENRLYALMGNILGRSSNGKNDVVIDMGDYFALKDV